MKANFEQEKAISSVNGPVILVSCPGSGKTTTLLRRINHMLELGVKPNRILMITFTKSAAAEMVSKFKINHGNPNGIMFLTIHALCLRILMHYGGYRDDNILKESDAIQFLMEQAYQDRQINDPRKAVSAFMKQYSSARNNLVDVRAIEPEGLPKESFWQFADSYEKMKQDMGKIDYDDMLICTLNLMKTKPDILRALQERWDYIQVDEYQDTNVLQRDIIYLLADAHKNLCVAGDDDQSIYRFRGARPEIMLNFPKDFPNAQVIRISTNYRSFPAIINYAGTLIRKNKERFSKEFLSGRDGKAKIHVYGMEDTSAQVDFILKDLANGCYTYDDTAILYRNNNQAEKIADVFYKNNIPFKSNEKIPDSYENWIWEDIMAYYRLSTHTEKSGDLRRIIDRPKRYLGGVYRAAGEKSKDGLLESADRILDGWKWNNAQKAIRTLYESLEIMGKMSPKEFLAYLMKHVGYGNYLAEYSKITNQDAEVFEESIRIYQNDASKFTTMPEWLNYIMRRSFSLKKKSEEGISLSTMHRSKGLEWKNVYIIDCNEGIIPSAKSEEAVEIEEERRLFYVGMTRAQEQLIMLYVRPNGKRKKQKSRFLMEMLDERKPARTISNSFHSNDMAVHEVFGPCMVLEVNRTRCLIFSLREKKQYWVEMDSLKR